MAAKIGSRTGTCADYIDLDSLAQVRKHAHNAQESSLRSIEHRLRKRAYRKELSIPIHIQLAQLRNSREQYYRNAIYCAERIYQEEDGQLRTHYCNGRLCPICQAIRTAKAMNKYLPSIQAFDDPHSLTLTRQTVPADELRETVAGMKEEFRRLNDSLRKRKNVSGIRKLEITYNARTDEYHPHFHLILNGEDVANAVLDLWLKRFRSTARREGQELRRIETGDNKGLHSVFGYATKLVTSIGTDREFVPVESLDTIVAALFGTRTLQAYGSLFQDGRSTEKITPGDSLAYVSPIAATVGTRIRWEWEQDAGTWINRETGEMLTRTTREPDSKLITPHGYEY